MTSFKFARISQNDSTLLTLICNSHKKYVYWRKLSLKFSSIFRLSNAIEFKNMIILSFRSRYVLKVVNKRSIKQLR